MPRNTDDEMPKGRDAVLAANLKRWREEAGFTQPEAAAFATVPLINLQHAEQGVRELRASVLHELAELYGRDFGDAFKSEIEQRPPDFSGVPVGRLVLHPRADEIKKAALIRKFATLHDEVRRMSTK